jgi:hypothetical protein
MFSTIYGHRFICMIRLLSAVMITSIAFVTLPMQQGLWRVKRSSVKIKYYHIAPHASAYQTWAKR